MGVPKGQDGLLLEAQNLARLSTGETPLVGGDDPQLNPSDFSGVTPRISVAATPNIIAASTGATPMLHGAKGGLAAGGGAAVPGETPLRDGLRINSGGGSGDDDGRSMVTEG